jgi:hypothetical protein
MLGTCREKMNKLCERWHVNKRNEYGWSSDRREWKKKTLLSGIR